MDDDPGSSLKSRPYRTLTLLATVLVVAAVLSAGSDGPPAPDASASLLPADGAAAVPPASAGAGYAHTWSAYLPPRVLIIVACLVLFSAFFSASEVAFFNIHAVRLRTLAEDGSLTGRLVAKAMASPARLLTTILVGNMIVNVLIGVMLGTRVEDILYHAWELPEAAAYVLAVIFCTGILVFLGEVTPKVAAVRFNEVFARAAVIPLLGVDILLNPLREGLDRLVGYIFRVTRFDKIRKAPFITDEEFKTVLSDGEAYGVIDEEGRQMIQGILEFRDAMLSEILVPRPDVVALPEDAPVGEALDLYREKEFSRMPVYRDSLDHITGVLFAKDLLTSVDNGELNRSVGTLARTATFVPATMNIRDFVKRTQHLRTHLAIVVDEYGGTEGLVTLEDAIEEVVGEIEDEKEEKKHVLEQIDDTTYRVDGALPLDELSALIGIDFESEEHETAGGFVMDQTEKIPEEGDCIVYKGARITVERVDGKRAVTLRVKRPVRLSEERRRA